MEKSLLENISSPAELKQLPAAELPRLCEEIRAFLIKAISKTGGHLSSNLGVVELTVMLHRIFTSPEDKIVFDVGHQCYTHKLLTGRREQFYTLRQTDGIAGFPKPSESPHDAYIAGHSSTAISVAYGMAKAMELRNEPHYAIAVVGDGALTGGEAYEALNNAGRSKTRLIVILNHNDMSISKNVGAFARYLSRMRSRPGYLKLKRRVDGVLTHTPLVGKPVKSWLERSKSTLKTVLYRSTFFEEMGFAYLGPVDGHDIKGLSEVLARAKEIAAPVIVQVETQKGKGYSFAEENPGAYHATGSFDILNGGDNATAAECYSNEAGAAITVLAGEDSRVCAITAAMKYGTGLHLFRQEHPARFFDVGIAEEHAVTFAGGLASQGMLPVFCVYSTFLQRGYDQIIHDLAIAREHVVLCIDRAGLVGGDGETHQGLFDAGFLSQIPGTVIYSPEGYEELRLCIRQAAEKDGGIACVRYPKGKAECSHSLLPALDFTFVERPSRQLMISYGREFSNCFLAAEELGRQGHPVSLLKLTRIHPLPEEIFAIIARYDKILFAEEGVRTGGIAEQLAARLLERGWKGDCRIKAVDDRFLPQGDVPELMHRLGLDAQSLMKDLLEQEEKLG